MPHLVYIAVGANLSDPTAQVRAAFTALAQLPESQLLRTSSLYRTAPVGIDAEDKQPDFINAVVALETTLTPQHLLAALHDIETQFGRRRDYHHAPRTLDLDLLLYGNEVIDAPQLHVPHPRMHLRAFVIAPLVEIAPNCAIPGRGLASAWLPAVSVQRIERLNADAAA